MLTSYRAGSEFCEAKAFGFSDSREDQLAIVPSSGKMGRGEAYGSTRSTGPRYTASRGYERRWRKRPGVVAALSQSESTETKPGSTDGFTLVEILVAMMVLAIGLLGLEALAIGAARSVTLAGRQSDFALVAADSLESALHQLRRSALPSQFCREDLRFEDRLSRSVKLETPQLASVTVTVLPGNSGLTPPADTFAVASSLFSPVAILGTPSGSPCG